MKASWLYAFGLWLAPHAALAEPASSTFPPPPAPTASWQPRHGLTLEAGLGLGFVRTADPYSRLDSPLYGVSLAAGAWLTPRTALTGRVLATWHNNFSGDDSTDYHYLVAGPSVQHWFASWAWASAGAGLAVYQVAYDETGLFHTSAGVGLDARLGVSIDRGTHHAVNVALELAPSLYRDVEVSLPPPAAKTKTFVLALLVLGYQFL